MTTRADLEGLLSLLLHAVQQLPADAALPPGVAPMLAPLQAMQPAQPAAPARTLSAWLDIHEAQLAGAGYSVQTLLGHADAEMTAIYLDGRDLKTHDWRRLAV